MANVDSNNFRRHASARSAPLAPDYREAPYWVHDAPAPPLPAEQLPAAADVVVIGSGYTGLHAALQIARGGGEVVVVDRLDPGRGCSTRNGGQISASVKPSLAALTRRFGFERAQAIRREGATALEWIEEFIQREQIACDFQRNGRFHAAHTRGHYERLVREAERLYREEGMDSFAVPRANQREELGTDLYHGGVVFARHAALHPAKYHRGLLAAALKAGVRVVSQCEALEIIRQGPEHRIVTAKGAIRAREVVVATNGYTGRLTPWLRRRVIPIGSYVIATEPLSPALIDQLFPSDRIASDTRRMVFYYRASPDRTRVLFGGRVCARETDPGVSGPLLHAEMCRIFPQLEQTRISYSWMGTVAYSFDELAHVGSRDGLHFALCYCGSGVSMASYLGMRMGQRVLEKEEGRTAFDDLPFPTRSLYTGSPWFLPAVVSWYRWRDRRECRDSSERAAVSP